MQIWGSTGLVDLLAAHDLARLAQCELAQSSLLRAQILIGVIRLLLDRPCVLALLETESRDGSEPSNP